MSLRDDSWRKIQTELSFQFARSSGPGGQNVNKNETKAELRWNVNSSQALTDYEKNLIIEKQANSINKDGELVIYDQQSKVREQNKKNCLEKFKETLNQALHIPKKRKPTKPSRAAKARRVDDKKKNANIKQNRKKVDW